MRTNSKIGVFPGTFDPVTFGHIDLIKRAAGIFDKVIVAVAHHSSDKRSLFTVDERKVLLSQAVKGLRHVTIDDFSGLVVDYAREKGARVMIRGTRMLSDFEYEFQMALTNRKLAEDIETIFLMPHEPFSTISSRMVREIAVLGGDLSKFVPSYVAAALKAKIAKDRRS